MRTIKTVPEMAADMSMELTESEKKRRIYKTESEEFKKQELATDIARAIDTISNSDKNRVNFNDVEDVRQRIKDYFTACASAGIYPSVQGLAVHGFGISRQALNQWRNKSRSPSYKYTSNETRKEVERLIDMACDMMADILTNQSLHNNANPVQSLFQLKNNHAFSDKVELAAVPYEEQNEFSAEELRERLGLYMDALPEPVTE